MAELEINAGGLDQWKSRSFARFSEIFKVVGKDV
jgi:hypothetical protein